MLIGNSEMYRGKPIGDGQETSDGWKCAIGGVPGRGSVSACLARGDLSVKQLLLKKCWKGWAFWDTMAHLSVSVKKKHSSGEEYIWESQLGKHKIRGRRGVSAAGLHGKCSLKRVYFSQTPVWGKVRLHIYNNDNENNGDNTFSKKKTMTNNSCPNLTAFEARCRYEAVLLFLLVLSSSLLLSLLLSLSEAKSGCVKAVHYYYYYCTLIIITIMLLLLLLLLSLSLLLLLSLLFVLLLFPRAPVTGQSVSIRGCCRALQNPLLPDYYHYYDYYVHSYM